jgi:hypothetical protein
MSRDHSYYTVTCDQCANSASLHIWDDDWGRWDADWGDGFRNCRVYLASPKGLLAECEKCGGKTVSVADASDPRKAG